MSRKLIYAALAHWSIWGPDFGQAPKIGTVAFVKKAVAAGWKMINLGMFIGEMHPDELKGGKLEKLIEELAKTGAKFFITPWMWSHDALKEPKEWLAQLDAIFPIVRAFQKAGLLIVIPGHTPCLRTDTGGSYPEGETWKQFVEMRDKISPTLREGAIKVSGELGWFMTCEPEHRFQGFSSPNRVLSTCEAVNHPAFGLTLDGPHVHHINILGSGNAEKSELVTDMKKAVTRWAPYRREWHFGETCAEEAQPGADSPHIVTALHLLFGDDRGIVDQDGYAEAVVENTPGDIVVGTVDHCHITVSDLLDNLVDQREKFTTTYGKHGEVRFEAPTATV